MPLYRHHPKVHAETTSRMQVNLLIQTEDGPLSYRLNGLPAFVWALLDGTRTEQQLLRDIRHWWASLESETAGLTRAQIRDVIGFLRAEGLVKEVSTSKT
jgi:hypothetical protein